MAKLRQQVSGCLRTPYRRPPVPYHRELSIHRGQASDVLVRGPCHAHRGPPRDTRPGLDI